MTTALRDAIDHTALGWVKPEIDETLRQARLEIEAFAESPADVERMQACAGYLHQVQGTLRMLELRAPAMVAEEMEQLAQALVTGKTGDLDEACSALMRGVVQLPDYLERYTYRVAAAAQRAPRRARRRRIGPGCAAKPSGGTVRS
jgi:chemosensory pili system protein ChpA (sensor histidine kinase/response regulator)